MEGWECCEERWSSYVCSANCIRIWVHTAEHVFGCSLDSQANEGLEKKGSYKTDLTPKAPN